MYRDLCNYGWILYNRINYGTSSQKKRNEKEDILDLAGSFKVKSKKTILETREAFEKRHERK